MRFLMAFVLFAITLCGGCQSFSKAPLTEVQGASLCKYLQSSDRNVLVEFGVNSDCGRCASMQESVVELATKYKDNTEVVRVDFANNTELAKKFGGTVCPTYVLFEKGQSDPFFVQSFPASKDNLEADILALLALSEDE